MHEEKENGETVTHVSTVEARSGSRTKVTRNILIISLVLIVIAFIATVGGGFFKTSESGADDMSADNTAINEAR